MGCERQLRGLRGLGVVRALAVAVVLWACAGLTVTPAHGQVVTETTSISYGTQENPWGFGWPIAVTGPWVFVGARNHRDALGHSSGLSRMGQVYAFRRTTNGWLRTQTFSPLSNSGRAAFGWHRIACEGSVLVIGDSLDGAAAFECGAVHIFQEAHGIWTHRQSVSHPRSQPSSAFGARVDFDGSSLIVGAPGDSSRGANAGAVFVYRSDASGVFTLEAELFGQNLPGMAQSGSPIFFGMNVAIDDGVAVVGSRVRGGVVTVFERLGGNWVERLDIQRPFPFYDARFGWHGLDVSGDWIAIGSPVEYEPSIPDFGRVFLYTRDAQSPSGWSYVENLTASNGYTSWTGSDEFGYAVQMRGDRMLVGAQSGRAGPHNRPLGQAHLFELQNGRWTEVQRLSAQRFESPAAPATVGRFGTAVAFDGGVMAVGDDVDMLGPNQYGHGQVFLYESVLGSAHCPGSSPTATLSVTGVATAALGSLRVRVDHLPGATLALLGASSVGAATPVGPGPGGLPCLSGPTRRLGLFSPSLPFGLTEVVLNLDLPALGVLAGETWAFQAWSREPAGPATSNAVALRFE